MSKKNINISEHPNIDSNQYAMLRVGMDHRYGSCPLKGYGSWVWIMGYGSHVLPGYGSEPYILSRSHICSNIFYEVVRHGAAFVKVAHRSVGFSCGNALLRQFELRRFEKEAMNL